MTTLCLRQEDIYRGDLMLVNEKYPIKKHTSRGMIQIARESESILMEARAAAMYTHLMRDIGNEDEIIPVSAYRSKEEQEAIYRESTERNGEDFTRKYVALPERSEHQTGLAVDVGENRGNVDFICPVLPYTGIYGRFRERAPRYGFIERYTKGKEKITGIAHEPWHFRYVGYPHSEIIRDKGFCLEEYTEYVKNYRIGGGRLIFQHKSRRIEIFYVPSCAGETETEVPGDAPYQLSGNNVDGFVVTVWGK